MNFSNKFDIIQKGVKKALASAGVEKYRSGHNERDSKSCCPQGHVGSNPTFSAIWAMRARKSRKPLALIVWSSWLTYLFGGVAQLGEHLLHTQGVTGSSPAVSTTKNRSIERFFHAFLFSANT